MNDPSLLPAPEPILLTGDELGDDAVSTEELRVRALAHARRHLQGRTATNTHTGWHIGIGRRGINKTLNHGARREHVQSVQSVPALFMLLERAVLVFTEANRDAEEARNIPLVHTFVAAVTIGAAVYRVRLIVKATNEGDRFYDHDLSAPPPTPTDGGDIRVPEGQPQRR